MSLRFCLTSVSAFFISTSMVIGQETDQDYVFPGPYKATVVEVVDADTVRLDVQIWPSLLHRIDLRIRGVDAPETRTNCESEKALGFEARDWVASVYPIGLSVRIEDVEPDPFQGRYLGELKRWRSDRWLPLSNELLGKQYGEIWYPGQQDVPWCLIAQERAAIKQ